MLAAEARLGRIGFAVLAALLWMAGAALCVRPGTRVVELGRFYAQLSLDPFAFEASPVGFRILTPLLSWAVGLRGEAIMITNLALAALLLVAVHLVFRARAPRPADALLAGAALAFSLVTLSTVFSPSYCDPATYLAVLGMWLARRRPGLFYPIFLLGLLNRESIAFLVPWFLFLAFREGDDRRRELGRALEGYGAAFALYFAFRAFVASQGEVGFTLDYYLDPVREEPLGIFRRTFGNQWLGLYSVFGVAWLIPLAAGVAMLRRGDRAGVASLLLLLACTWSQLLFAYDTSRLFTLGFLVMVLALDDLLAHDALRVRRWAPWVIAASAVLPHVRTAQQRVWVMDSGLGPLLERFAS